MLKYSLWLLIFSVTLDALKNPTPMEIYIQKTDRNESHSSFITGSGESTLSLSERKTADVNLSGDINMSIPTKRVSDERKVDLLRVIRELKPVEEKIDDIDQKIKVLEERLGKLIKRSSGSAKTTDPQLQKAVSGESNESQGKIRENF